MKGFKKQVYQYFNKWLAFTDYKKYVLNKSLKHLVLNSYNHKLRDAFTRWTSYKGHFLHKKQHVVIHLTEEEAKAITNEIVETKLDIQEKK